MAEPVAARPASVAPGAGAAPPGFPGRMRIIECADPHAAALPYRSFCVQVNSINFCLVSVALPT